MQNLDKILEGILFLSGDGVDRGIIMEKLQVTPKQLDNAVEILKKRYNDESGITFITYKDKLQLCGNQKFADDVSIVLNPIRERQLTRSTLEVMAIIAYKQPITRLDVQEIRGINSDYAIQTLLNYKLIEVIGRKDAIGKPLLFGTTDEFLNQIEDLPDYDELLKNVEEIELQNNHLYHEFEIPNDNSESNNEENNNEKTELTSTYESKNDNINNKNNFEGIDYDLLNEQGQIVNKGNLFSDFIKDNKNINQDSQENNQTNHENLDIDWNILADNPDIEQ